jgi:hypothetical protein
VASAVFFVAMDQRAGGRDLTRPEREHWDRRKRGQARGRKARKPPAELNDCRRSTPDLAIGRALGANRLTEGRADRGSPSFIMCGRLRAARILCMVTQPSFEGRLAVGLAS